MYMFNYKIKTSFVSPEMPNARANKTGFNIMVVIFTFVENSTVYDFSVWLSST